VYPYRRGLRRCSFNCTGQCEGLGAWNGQQVGSHAFLFLFVSILLFYDLPDEGTKA